jgi:membrane-bound lytic murein transglycosylase D
VCLSAVEFKRLSKSLVAASAILFSWGCSNLTLDKRIIEFPALEVVPESSLSVEHDPTRDREAPNETAAEVPDSAELVELPIEVLKIVRQETDWNKDDATDQDSLNSTDEDQTIALHRILFLCEQSRMERKRGELEKAVERLDQAWALLLKIDPQAYPGLLQEKEDLRVAISQRILEIYSSRLIAVQGNYHGEIPIPLNSYVQAEIEAFTSGSEKESFLAAYRRSGKYRKKIEAALEAADMPTELAWLPLIESEYKVQALSPARALGLWQFIPSTGYRYNLYRDRYIDERLDPEKSTRSAIQYLKELHEMFGDWTTVLAAYNCGEHRIFRLIQSQHINYLDNFWDLYERLPRETARYVPRFLATLHIVHNPKKFGLDSVEPDPVLEYESAAIFAQTSLSNIARSTGIDEDLLKELNAELRRGIPPVHGYNLRVPLGTRDLVAACANSFPNYQRQPQHAGKTHKVRLGESLSSIGTRYGLSVKRLMSANGLGKTKALRAGVVLRIPDEPSNKRRDVASGNHTRTAKTVEYVVRLGDSLFKIAKRFDTTTENIQKMNNMPTADLAVGQILKILTAT